MIRTLLFLFAIILLPLPTVAQDIISGRASVVDGDSLEIHGESIRLHGIDAPESNHGAAVITSPVAADERQLSRWRIRLG